MDLKKKVESVLFAAGQKISVEEIAKLVRTNELEQVEQALQELKGEYETRDSSIQLVQHGTEWKLTVKDDYLPTVRKIVKHTDLTKSVMETLAVVAYKSPVLQSEIIGIRTNKAYDHLNILEHQGFISRVKKGRTKLIRLSNKFFDYFDVPPDKLKERFSNVAALEKAVEEKEAEIGAQKSELEEKRQKLKKDEEEFKAYVEDEHKRLDKEIAELPEIDLLDDEGEAHKLDNYKTEKKEEPETPKKTVRGVEIYDAEPETAEKPEKKPEPAEAHIEEEEATAEIKKPENEEEIVEEEETEREEAESEEETAEPEEPTKEELMEEQAEKIAAGKESRKFEGKGVFPEGVPEEVERKIDERVEEIVHGHHETPEEPKEEEE